MIKTKNIETFNCELTEFAEKKLCSIFKDGRIIVTEISEGRYMVLHGILRHKIAVDAGVEELDCVVVDTMAVLDGGHIIITDIKITQELAAK